MSATANTFKKGDKVSYSYTSRTGTTIKGTGTVQGKSPNSARISVQPANGGPSLTLWPSALRAA